MVKVCKPVKVTLIQTGSVKIGNEKNIDFGPKLLDKAAKEEPQASLYLLFLTLEISSRSGIEH